MNKNKKQMLLYNYYDCVKVIQQNTLNKFKIDAKNVTLSPRFHLE